MKVRLPSFAYSENLKVPEEPKQEPIPDDIPLLELADMAVRGKVKLGPQQMRMLIEMLPFIAPKLSAVALNAQIGADFAARLDRCIERSAAAKFPRLIEAKANEVEAEPEA